MKFKETHSVELKNSLAQLNDALKAVAALAGEEGGKIYLGVSPSGRVVGVEVSDKILRKISQQIRSRISPDLCPTIKEIKVQGKSIIEITVPEGINKPYFRDKVPYKRVGTEDVAIPTDEWKRMVLEQKKIKWDEEFCKKATLKDVDEEKIKWFLDRASNERNLDVDSSKKEAVLSKLNLLKNNKLTNAGVLLFGKEPQKYFPQVRIRCARFKGVTKDYFIDQRVIDGSLFNQVDGVEQFVLQHIKKAAKIVGLERQEMWEYPIEALREAIINAIVHRDYQISGNIQLAVYDDRVEIWNPGDLPSPLTISMLKKVHASIPRNNLIADAFFLVRYIEQWGRGTTKIINLCVSHGLKEPLFEEKSGGFSVSMFAPEDILSLIPESNVVNLKEVGLNKRQISTLKMMVNKNKKISIKEYASTFKISDKTAKRDIKKLVESGYVIKRGVKKGAYFEAK